MFTITTKTAHRIFLPIVAAATIGLAGCGPKTSADASTAGAVSAQSAAANTNIAANNVDSTAPATYAPPVPVTNGTQPANTARVGQPVPAAQSTFQVPAPNDGGPPPPMPNVQAAPPPVQTAPPAQVAQAVPAPVKKVVVSAAQRGSVSSIEEVHEKPKGTGAGAVIGGVLGAVVGNQFGHGNGRAAMTIGGAAAGAFGGNAVERKVNERVVGYRVSVRLDNGQSRVYQEPSVAGLRIGDRVRVDGNRVRPA